MESPARVHVFYIDYGNVSAGTRVESRQGRDRQAQWPLTRTKLTDRAYTLGASALL